MQDQAPETSDGKAPSPEVQITRMLVRAIWQQEWSAANPGSSAKDRTAAWKEVRAEQMKTRGKLYRKALMDLQKAGVVLTLPEDVTREEAEA